MQPSKIYYERNFPLNQPFLFEKYGIEVTINPGEDPEQAYAYAIEAIERAHKVNSPGFPDSYGPPVQPTMELPVRMADKTVSERDSIIAIQNDINSCKELKVLESYRFIAKSHELLQMAYDEMLKKLSQ